MIAGCSIGAVFGLYGQLLLSHALSRSRTFLGGRSWPSHRTHERRNRQRSCARHRRRTRLPRGGSAPHDGATGLARAETGPPADRRTPGARARHDPGAPPGASKPSRERSTIGGHSPKQYLTRRCARPRLTPFSASEPTSTVRPCSARYPTPARGVSCGCSLPTRSSPTFSTAQASTAPTSGTDNGLQLHQALVEALDPQLVISDYYRFHPWHADGGYIRALVDSCRTLCIQLPSYKVYGHSSPVRHAWPWSSRSTTSRSQTVAIPS